MHPGDTGAARRHEPRCRNPERLARRQLIQQLVEPLEEDLGPLGSVSLPSTQHTAFAVDRYGLDLCAADIYANGCRLAHHLQVTIECRNLAEPPNCRRAESVDSASQATAITLLFNNLGGIFTELTLLPDHAQAITALQLMVEI